MKLGDLVADYTKRLVDQDAEFTQQRNTFVASATKDLADLNVAYAKNAQDILDRVEQRRKEVETLVGVIGNLGVTSGYQKTANNARISMWIWQGITVAGMGLLILLAYHAFLPTITGDFKWAAFAGRAFVTITVGVLAAYAAAQADQFFKIEKYNRKLALELAAIDPFIALLPLEQQQNFKLEIGRRSFAQEEIPVTGDGKSPATVFDVLARSKQGEQAIQLLLDAAQKFVKEK